MRFASKGSIRISNPFEGFFSKKKNLKTVYRSRRKQNKQKTRSKSNQEVIDAILDKISKSGYESLNQEEKNLLFKQGKNKN